MTVSPAPRKRTLVRAAERPPEVTFAHPLNPSSEMRGVSLSDLAGLCRIGFHLVTIPPGREANIYHRHTCEEEFFYILGGRGIAEIDGEAHEVGPGDFLGFAAPSVPHQLRNPFDQDLVYLVGGERREVEFAEFPRLHKHLVRIGREAWVTDSDRLELFWRAPA